MKKLSKSMVGLAALLVVVAATMGCVDKATGGGWFNDCKTGDRCTFGFNAQYKDNPGAVANEKQYTGQFQFKDHETGVKFHLKEIILLSVGENSATFMGSEKDGTSVYVFVSDAGEPGWSEGDFIMIHREGTTWAGYLGGGNIQTHETK